MVTIIVSVLAWKYFSHKSGLYQDNETKKERKDGGKSSGSEITVLAADKTVSGTPATEDTAFCGLLSRRRGAQDIEQGQ